MSFSFAERLVTQRMRLREREASIELERESLAVKEQLIERLTEKLEAEKELLAKVKQVCDALEKSEAESEVAYKEAQRCDEEARAALAEEYKGQLSAVNEQLQAVSQREAKANHLNSTYKQQIEIYTQKAESGEAKFDEYMKQRDDKVNEVKAKQVSDAAKVLELKELLVAETEKLEVSRVLHSEARAKVDAYLARFAEIQTQLDASKKTYEEAKDEKERKLRYMNSLEADRAQAQRRAESSREEHDKQLAKVKALQEKLESVKALTDKFNKLRAAFEASAEPRAPAIESHADPQPAPEAEIAAMETKEEPSQEKA